ncbi:unnamed protein product [Phyllotreta striolata]|uniref:Uncharacterized protein n=1 Tax=Phyllotreta striolata TaxID=444603 RepID=A0A9N9XJG7_PHYSR|nr:unnamed protein product [Phyllotreta striolata]
MSLQKGNTSRTRPQKHQNRSVFKNNLHDTSHRTKMVNSIQVSDVCTRCKDIIEWKIKYKKYKPLSQAKTCVKCGQKTVKQAYHVMCTKCGRDEGVCTKCCEKKDVVVAAPTPKNQYELDLELKQILSGLPERKRRTFLRYIEKKQHEEVPEEEQKATNEKAREELLEKLNSLKVSNDDDDDFDDDFISDSDQSDDVDDDE